MADMYEVVANVEDYKEFVPWCTKSTIVARKPGHFRAQLEIGFPPLVERYMSTVTVAKPHLVKVYCCPLLFLEIEKRMKISTSASHGT